MKFNPYAVLLTTGALMLLTVVVGQTGSSVALLKRGAASVDKDVSSFAARTISSLQRHTPASEEQAEPQTRVALADKQKVPSEE
jgi:hypothetical protein